MMPFGGEFLSQSADENTQQIHSQLKHLNSLSVFLSAGKEPVEDIIEYILNIDLAPAQC